MSIEADTRTDCGVSIYTVTIALAWFGALSQVGPGEWVHTPLLQSGLRISSFGEDEFGELYVVDHGGGIYWLKRSDVP